MIKNLVFDAGGVLIDLDRSAVIREFTAIGYPQADALIDPYKQSGIFLQLEAGEITPQDLYDYIRNQTGLPIEPKQIDNALYKFLTCVDNYKLSLLLELRKKYNVYMLSNTNAIMMPYAHDTFFTQQGLTAEDYFDHMYVSYEMGCVKPYPEIFQKMFADSGMIPSESLMIDDSAANIKTAGELGMQTLHVTQGDDLRELLKNL